MSILGVDLNNINLDDANFDENHPVNIVLVRLVLDYKFLNPTCFDTLKLSNTIIQGVFKGYLFLNPIN